MMLPIVDAVAQATNQTEEVELNKEQNQEEIRKEEEDEDEIKDKEKEHLMQGNENTIPKIPTFELYECTDKTNDDEHDADDKKWLINIDDETFEDQLRLITNGKINSIHQLKYLTSLDDGCGHFDDLETIAKVNSKGKLVDGEAPKSTFKRTKTMKMLHTKQEEQKEIRKKLKSDVKTPQSWLMHLLTKHYISHTKYSSYKEYAKKRKPR